MTRFVVPGEPVPKARARIVRRGEFTTAFTPQRTRDAEDEIGWAWRDANRGVAAMVGRVGLRCTFYTAKKEPTSDLDNLVKTVKDALNELAYVDDRQVDELQVKRILEADDPRTVIDLWPLVRLTADEMRREGAGTGTA